MRDWRDVHDTPHEAVETNASELEVVVGQVAVKASEGYVSVVRS